jgi:hypothetical protein
MAVGQFAGTVRKKLRPDLRVGAVPIEGISVGGLSGWSMNLSFEELGSKMLRSSLLRPLLSEHSRAHHFGLFGSALSH